MAETYRPETLEKVKIVYKLICIKKTTLRKIMKKTGYNMKIVRGYLEFLADVKLIILKNNHLMECEKNELR